MASPQPGGPLKSLALDRALEDRMLALDPTHVTGADVRETLVKAPAPRVVLIHGGIYPVYLAMSSFAEFLIGMGYPEAELRRPDNVLDSLYSYSPYQDSRELAGLIAWYYERDGMRPMIVGHSQGGVQAVKVLDELAGIFGDELTVWNPVTDAAEARTTIVDPLSGEPRPVVGVTVSYVSVVGAGGAALLLPNQWSMVHRLRTIPDTVDEFTGFSISVDLVALTFPGARGAAENGGRRCTTRRERGEGTAAAQAAQVTAKARAPAHWRDRRDDLADGRHDPSRRPAGGAPACKVRE